MTPDLFAEVRRDPPLAEGAVLLGGFALPMEAPLLAALASVVAEAPFRHMVTPGGFTMSVAMTLTIHQFSPRSIDGWSSRVMQGFRLFSGAGSTGGWNKWDRRLGGRDQG